MNTTNRPNADRFFVLFAAIAMVTPILLVIISGMYPEGLARGELIVNGHGILLFVLATVMGLRISYGLGLKNTLGRANVKSHSSLIR